MYAENSMSTRFRGLVPRLVHTDVNYYIQRLSENLSSMSSLGDIVPFYPKVGCVGTYTLMILLSSVSIFIGSFVIFHCLMVVPRLNDVCFYPGLVLLNSVLLFP